MTDELCPARSKTGRLCNREFDHLGNHIFGRAELTRDEKLARRCDVFKKKDGKEWRCALNLGDHGDKHVYPVLPWDDESFSLRRR